LVKLVCLFLSIGEVEFWQVNKKSIVVFDSLIGTLAEREKKQDFY